MTQAAIVLAGGAATRFGGDKLAATIDGETVLARSVAIARSVSEAVVVVLGPDDPDPRLEGATIARDAVAHRGPLAGLLAGLDALETGVLAPAEPVLVLAGDMPRVRAAVLRLLVDALVTRDHLAAAHLEADPVATLPMAVRPSLAGPAARELLAADRRSLRALLDAVPAVAVPAATWRSLDEHAETLVDIDTPADLAR